MTEKDILQESMLPVGSLLHNGVYRIERYLSSGGFGNTYVATNVEFGERVAVKEFFMSGVTLRDSSDLTKVTVSHPLSRPLFDEQLQKFKKEARRLRRLSSPHIVSVHDLFEENGTAYYVMDYIEGEDLSRRLKRLGHPLDEDEVKGYLTQVLDALDTVHREQVFHLDLKPANILVDKRGQVILIDFGASKQHSQGGGATTSTAVSYTNGFAPREQMEQNLDKFGAWTDIYALGATLYNLLTNQAPPLPSDIDDDPSDDKHDVLVFPGSVSAGMRQLILKMMSTNRVKRPQTIAELKNIISEIDSQGKFLRKPTVGYEQKKKKENSKIEKLGKTKIIDEYQPEPDADKDSWITKIRWLWWLPLIMAMGFFIFYIVSSNTFKIDSPQKQVVVVDTASDGMPIWSAENIEITYLKDSTQYVCDPDGLLFVEYRDSANFYLNKLNREFDIQSVFVVVNHVKNADAFRMAQDIGNNYGVGHKDTRIGLVVVIAVQDRQFFIATGKGLEDYLTDVMCNNIANNYLKPNMLEGNTDLAVMQTCQALYNQIVDVSPPTLHSK